MKEEERQSEWAMVATFSTGFEADIARATLESAGILVMKRGEQTGIFGPSFQGPVMGGIDILVPAADLEQARELISAK